MSFVSPNTGSTHSPPWSKNLGLLLFGLGGRARGRTRGPLGPMAEAEDAQPKSRLSLNLQSMVEGEQALTGGEFITTARAQNEVAITVRGDAKVKAKRILQLLPSVLGKDKIKAAWRPPKGNQLAVACFKEGNLILSLYGRQTMPKPMEVRCFGRG